MAPDARIAIRLGDLRYAQELRCDRTCYSTKLPSHTPTQPQNTHSSHTLNPRSTRHVHA